MALFCDGLLRACWEFIFGDKKDVFFGLMMSNFFVITVAIANKFEMSKRRRFGESLSFVNRLRTGCHQGEKDAFLARRINSQQALLKGRLLEFIPKRFDFRSGNRNIFGFTINFNKQTLGVPLGRFNSV